MIFQKLKSSYFIKNTATLIGGTTIAQALPLLFAPVISRLFLPEDFSLYGIFISIYAIAGSAITLKYERAIMLPVDDNEAKEIVTIFHNSKEAQKAQEEFEQVFEDKKLPTEIEEVKIENGEHNTQELLVKLSLAKSKNEARRLIEQGGVKVINNNKAEVVKTDTIKTEKGMIVQVGKRNFKRIA